MKFLKAGPSLMAALLVMLLLALGPTGGPDRRPADAAELLPAERPNFVFILADDMEAGQVEFMPKTRALLAEGGTTFSNAFVTHSLCCPSRSSILTGRYSHNHRVLTNAPPLGGYPAFRAGGHEGSNVATWLDGAGYQTALVGKYLNHYPQPDAPAHVPRGWDEWYALMNRPDPTFYGYYDYRLNENGTVVPYGSAPEDYQTDVLAQKANDFVRRASADPAGAPFFLYLAPEAPHNPFTPAPRHEGAYPEVEGVPRTAAFDEANVSDKPSWIRARPRLSAGQKASLDRIYRERAKTLLGLDDMVSSLVEELRATGELENTYVVFTSDNGYHTGHRRAFQGKGTAYEEDVRVPLLVRGPGVPAGRSLGQIALNTDFAPTFAALAGVSTPPSVDGRSLGPLLSGEPPASWRRSFLVELWMKGSKPPAPAFMAVRTQRYTYVRHRNGERELYDLSRDPLQLRSMHATASPTLLKSLDRRLAALRSCSGEGCRRAEDAP